MNKIIEKYLKLEKQRQKKTINLIASENFVSKEIMKLNGSCLTNKYAEGYPDKRYYLGCENIDQIENLAINKAKELFKCEYVNVQPHSGSQANAAVYLALLKPHDKVLAMDLNSGGHLTHGSKVNFSGIIYDFYHYGVDKNTNLIDYENISHLAKKIRPKLIVCGASSYPRIIDFKRFSEIAKSVDAYLLADIAHIAGLIVTGLHPTPVGYADVITMTTHKSLRGTRGGVILAKDKFKSLINKAIFPGIQGGPLMHVIAGKAQTFIEALNYEFKIYQKNVLNNMQALALSLKNNGFNLITEGTDNHLLLINTKKSVNMTGKEAADLLIKYNICCNMNVIPFETEKTHITSGIRLGSLAMTTRKWKEKHFFLLGKIISKILKEKNKNKKEIKEKIKELWNL